MHATTLVSRRARSSDKVLTLMDLITVAMLAFFGSLLAGGIVGWAVGRFCAFELALGIGLLIPGLVALTFSTRCLLEYQHFRAPDVTTAIGEVVAVKDRPVNASGSVTQPVPVVQFTAADNIVYSVEGPAASGLKVGARVTVLYEGGDPRRAVIAKVPELRNAAIAFMLFGTFPLSLGLWFIHSHLYQRREMRTRGSEPRGLARETAHPTFAQRLRKELIVSFNLLLVTGIFWIGFAPGSLEENFIGGFGLVALALLGHGIRGFFDPQTNASWCLGMFVLALNFSVWALALWLLF